MLDLKQKYKLNDNIILRRIDDKCWALNIENGNQYRLNDTSYFILDLLRETSTIENIIFIIQNEYKVTREQLIADISLMLQVAINKNILKEV